LDDIFQQLDTVLFKAGLVEPAKF